MTAAFESDTSVVPMPGGWRGNIDSKWWVLRGPNGGYVAALVLRAMEQAVADPTRMPRSLTVHFIETLGEGPVEVHTTTERRGKTLSSVSARLIQEDRVCALALGAFAASRPAFEYSDSAMPDVDPPERCARRVRSGPMAPLVLEQFDARLALGGEPMSGGAARAGGWIHLSDLRPLDFALATAYLDAWYPPIFVPLRHFMAAPTLDFTVHFRQPLPPPGTDSHTFYFVSFVSRLATGGMVEEDGELWSPDGLLLAQSRQMSMLVEFRP